MIDDDDGNDGNDDDNDGSLRRLVITVKRMYQQSSWLVFTSILPTDNVAYILY